MESAADIGYIKKGVRVMASHWQGGLKKIDDYRWEIPPDYKKGMLVPGIVYADDAMIQKIMSDQALEQVANVAFLPGIVFASLACLTFTGDMAFQ